MDQWDPREEDYQSDFNSYDRGPGRNLSKNKKQDGIRLYVTGIPNEVTEEGLYNLFSQCGNCLSTKKCPSKQKDSGDTFGFVVMGSQKEAVTAIKEFNNFQINKFKLRVKIALDDEAIKKRNQQRLEEEEFINSLPSTKYEKARKSKLKSVTRTIENDKQSQSDTENSSGQRRSKKKTTSTSMNGHEDRIPELQEIQDMNDSGQWNENCKSGKNKQGILGPAPVSGGYPDDRGQRLPRSVHVSAMSRHADSDIDEMYMDPSLLYVERTPQRNDFSPEIFHSYGRGQGILGPAPNASILGPAPNMAMSHIQTWQQRSDFSGEGGYYYGGEHSVNYNNNYGGGYGRGRPQHAYYRRGGFLGPRRGGSNYQYNHYNSYSYTYGEYNNYRGRGRGGGGYRPPFHHGSMESMTSHEQHRKPLQKVDDKPCLNCSKPGRFQCTECKSPYCSQECQINHWSKHKEDCRKIKEDTEEVDALEEQFEFSVGEDIVQKTKTLVENFTGDKVIIKPKEKENILPKEKKPELRKPKLQTLQKSQHQEVKKEKHPLPVRNTKASSQQAVNTTVPKENGFVPLVSETTGRTLKSCDIPMNTVTKVIVTEVVAPDEIWVQLLTEQVQAITALGDTMKSVFEEANSEVVRLPRVGDIFGCQFSLDGNWYRARVDSVVGKDVSVTYVDYGNQEIVTFDKLRLLQDNMTDLPMQAIECRLVNVEPLVGKEWESKAKEMIKSCLPPTLTCQALYSMYAVSKFSGKIDITLANDKDEDIGLKLIANGVAKARTSNEVLQTVEKKVVVENKEVVEKKAVTEKAEAASVYSTLTKGEDVMVMVMEVESPDEIWVKVADPVLIEKAVKFTEELNKMAAANSLRKVAQPIVGCLYSSQFEASWYRARLDAFKQDNTVLVTYIDYGNKDIVLASSLRELDAGMKSEPFCVVHCALGGITPTRSASDWDTAVITQLKELVPKTEVSGIFYNAVAENEINNVTIIKLKTLEDHDIATGMIEAGMAQRGERIPTVYPPLSSSPKASSVATSATKPITRSKDVEKKTVTEKSEPAIVYSTLPKDKDTLVMVMEVESPDEIWVQEADESIITRGMQVTREINRMVEENKLEAVTDLCIGNMYVAQFDGDWYRARVDGFKDNNAIVTFVDFGNKDVIPSTSMLELNSELKLVPLCVVHCCLDGIVPLEDNGDWNDAAIKKLQEFLPKTNEIGAFYTATVTFDSKTSHLHVVKLKNDIGEDIASKMIESGTVRQGKREPPTYPPVAKVATPVEGAALEIQPIRRHVIQASSLRSMIDDYQVDQRFYILIIASKSPAEFIIQICSEELIAKFQKFQEDLNIACSSYDSSYRPENVGQLVIGNFDGMWYRAEILTLSDRTATVRYIDFGNEEEKEFTSIQCATEECGRLPAQACNCSLVDIKGPQNGVWSDDVMKKFKNLISDADPQPLEAVYKGKQDGVAMIDILDPVAGKSISRVISQMMSGARPKSPAAVVSKMDKVSPVVVKTVPVVKASEVPMECLPSDGVRCAAGVIEIVKFDSFYLQLVDKQEVIAKLQVDLASFCSGIDTPHTPVIGELVCAKYSADNSWYRAEVLSTASEGLYSVLFVDYGNKEDVDPQNMRKIHQSLLTPPKQAVHCQLSGVLHENQTEESFQNFEACMKQTLVQVIAMEFKNEKYSVQMFGEDDLNVNEHFGTKGRKQVSPNIKEEVIKCEQEAVKVLSHSPVPSQPLRIERIEQISPPDTGHYNVVITSIDSPEEFYCQIADQAAVEKLTLLMQSMMLNCETNAPNPDFCPKVGDLCSAQYSGDQRWYRSVVVQVFPKDKAYKVRYVDFGNTEVINQGDIRETSSDFFDLPVLAFKCSLQGVMPVEGSTWTTEAGMKLGSYCNVPLLARTVGKTSSGSCLLDLTFVSDEGSVNVAESLKTSGVAKTRTVESSDAEAIDKEALLLQQIAELQKQLQAIKTNKS